MWPAFEMTENCGVARNRNTVFEDILEIAARLPWWAGVMLAVVAYGVFHSLATQSNVVPTDLKGMGAFAGKELWRVLASFFQYIVPVAFLVGAGVSAVRAARARRLHADVSRAPSRGALEAMSWREFEELVGETFRRRGFAVERRGGNGPDGGVDLALRLGGDSYLVQCKQWKARSVGVATVRELFGVMAAEGAVGGFVVASGGFTAEARRFAEGRAIELVATHALLAMVQSGNISEPVTPADNQPAVLPSPVCPQCAAPMELRTARRGANPGQQFWGCLRYPECRGTRNA